MKPCTSLQRAGGLKPEFRAADHARNVMLMILMLGAPWVESFGQVAAPVVPQAAASDRVSRDVAAAVLKRLDAAWNAADGKAFAAEFSDDAWVINIFGGVFQGRPAVEQRMQTIFNTIFKGGSHKSRELEMTRTIAPGVVLAVSSAVIAVPTGALAPEARNRQTFILTSTQGGWKISHWQNTPIEKPE